MKPKRFMRNSHVIIFVNLMILISLVLSPKAYGSGERSDHSADSTASTTVTEVLKESNVSDLNFKLGERKTVMKGHGGSTYEFGRQIPLEQLNKRPGCINGEFCVGSDLEMAFHILPPLGEDLRYKTFDRTLTEFLNLSVCEVNDTGGCTVVEEFTSQNHHKGLDFIKLRGDHYHVNWKVAKDSAGKEFEIHFKIGDLEVCYVTYTPPTGRTVPIKFQIEKNAVITAFVLKLEGLSAESITQVLIDEFELGMEEILRILKYTSFSCDEIGLILRDFFGLTAEVASSTLKSINCSCLEVGEVLKDLYSLNAHESGSILDSESCGAEEIFDVFTVLYGLTEMESEETFEDMGWDQSEYLWITAYKHVKQFAPHLLFDKEQEDFPMDAQKWFYIMLCEGNNPKDCFKRQWNKDNPFSNQDKSTLRYGNSPHSTVEGGKIPTYYRMRRCGLGQLRIEYWWFYGNQPQCSPDMGHHPADWERIMVITNDDRTDVAAILFYQHSGWYIKNCQRWQESMENHPDVYVGKNSHGSYFKGNRDVVCGTCLYYGDCRGPVWKDVPDGTVWKTWELSTFINVQGSEYSPDLPDKPNQPKEAQQSWIQYTKELGKKFPWGYLYGEGKVSTNPYLKDGGAEEMCNRSACEDEGCTWNHTDCKCCRDHTNIGLHCEAGLFQLYDKDYWVPTYDRALYLVISGPGCFPGTNYCPCVY